MSNTLLVSTTGKTATLGALAAITETPGETEIRRENLQRLVAVTARFEGVDLGSGMPAVQKAVNGLHLPSSIRVEYGGQYQEQQRSFRELLKVLFLALLLLFAVLLFEFRTFSAPTAFLLLRFSPHSVVRRALNHSHHLQRSLPYGHDHGHRVVAKKRHPPP